MSLVALFVVHVCAGQPLEFGPRIGALGGAGVALSERSSALLNPASLASTPAVTVDFGFARAFGLPELDQMFAGAYVPARRLAVGVTVERFGFELFRQHTLHVAASRSIGSGTTTVGLATTLRHVSIHDYGTNVDLGARLGMIVGLGDFVWVGAVLNRVVTNRHDGSTVVAGLVFRPAAGLTVVWDMHKDWSYPISLRSGLELSLARPLSLRGGYSTAPSAVTLGIGVRVGTLDIGIATHHHATLGWSRALGLRIGS